MKIFIHGYYFGTLHTNNRIYNADRRMGSLDPLNGYIQIDFGVHPENGPNLSGISVVGKPWSGRSIALLVEKRIYDRFGHVIGWTE